MAIKSVSEIANREEKELNGNISAIRTIDSTGTDSQPIAVPSHDLSVGSLNFTTSETEDFILDYIYFDFTAPISETITLTKITSGIDEVLESEAIISANNARLVSLQNVFIKASEGEQLRIEITNITASATVETVLKKVGV